MININRRYDDAVSSEKSVFCDLCMMFIRAGPLDPSTERRILGMVRRVVNEVRPLPVCGVPRRLCANVMSLPLLLQIRDPECRARSFGLPFDASGA